MSEERGVWSSGMSVMWHPMLYSEASLATLQEPPVNAEQRVPPSLIPQPKSLHAPSLETERQKQCKLCHSLATFRIFPSASTSYSINCSSATEYKIMSVYSMQGTGLWRKERVLPFYARECAKAWLNPGKAVLWPGCSINRLLPGMLAGASCGSGYLLIIPFPLNVGSKPAAFISRETRIFLTIWCVLMQTQT